MIDPANPLELTEANGVKTILQEKFIADWAEDAEGRICRPAPLSITMPFGHKIIADRLREDPFIEKHDIWVAELLNSTIIGQRAFLLKSGSEVITDSTHSRHRADIFKLEERAKFESTRLKIDDDGQKFLRINSDLPLVKLDGEIVALTAMEFNNYGAFLVRLLPKLIALKKLNLDNMRILAPIAHPWQLNIFRAFGVDILNIVAYDSRHDYFADRFYVPSLRSSEFFFDDLSRGMFQEFGQRYIQYFGKKTHIGEKIYVSRVGQSKKHPDHRRCMNEEILASTLSRLGFDIVEPETLSFEDQVIVFANARVVIGPGGAGMFNTIFCRSDTVIIDLEPQNDWVVMHANLFSGCQHPYALILGGSDETDPSRQKRWSADIQSVIDTLKYF